MKKSKYLIIGKMPPPYYGTSVWFEALHNNAKLRDAGAIYYDTGINRSIHTLSKPSLLKLISILRKFRGFTRLIREQRPELVLIPLSQSLPGFLRDSFFIRKTLSVGSIPLLMLHGSRLLIWYKMQNSIVKRYIYSCISKAGGAIVLGNSLKHIFEPFLPESAIFVVPNGLNVTIPRATCNSRKMQFLYLGNLQETKGITDIIDAISLLDRSLFSRFHLNVVGSWRERKTKEFCLRTVSKLELPVTFCGPLYKEEKFQVMANHDVLVFTPRAPEGHPLVIIEAMAAGLAIIATDQGAIKESVREGENGFIIGDRDPGAIAEKIKYLMENEPVRKKMGEAARKLYEEKFTEERMIEDLLRAMRKVLEMNDGKEGRFVGTSAFKRHI